MGFETNKDKTEPPEENKPENENPALTSIRSSGNNNNTYSLGQRDNEILWRIRYTPKPSQPPSGQLRQITSGIVSHRIGVIVAIPPESPRVLQLYRRNFQTNFTTNLDLYRNNLALHHNTEATVESTIEEQEEPGHNLRYPVIPTVPAQSLPTIYKESSIHKEYKNNDIHNTDNDKPFEEDWKF